MTEYNCGIAIFSTVRSSWKDIVNDIKLNNDYKIVDIFVARYDLQEWDEYFLNFYAQNSSTPGVLEFEDESKKLIMTPHGSDLLGGKTSQEKLGLLIKKGSTIAKSGKDMCIVLLKSNAQDEENKKQILLKFKNQIRNKYFNITQNRWSIVHSFDTELNTAANVDFIKKHCNIFKVIGV